MARKGFKESVGEELAYAAADLRSTFERVAFGREVTPMRWQENLSRGHGDGFDQKGTDPSDFWGKATVHGHDPDAPDALQGIGHSGEDYNPDHTRDAVRSFYGLDDTPDYQQSCQDMFAPSAGDDDQAPDMSQRIKR